MWQQIFDKAWVAIATVIGLIASITFLKTKRDNAKLETKLNQSEFDNEKHETEKTNSERSVPELIDRVKKRLGD